MSGRSGQDGRDADMRAAACVRGSAPPPAGPRAPDGFMSALRTVLAGMAILGAAAAPAAPRIACDEPVFHFGRRLSDGPEFTHVYTLRNDGDEPLELGEIVSGCGCAVARLEYRILPPSTRTALEIRVNLRGRSGHLSKEISVRSNDPRTPLLKLGMEGEIESAYSLSPTAAMFGPIAPDAAATQTVTLAFCGNPAARVTSVAADAPWLAVEAAATTGGTWKISVRTVPPFPDGASWLVARVQVKTTDPRASDVTFAATATPLREVAVGPPELVLIEGEPGPATRFALIRPGSVPRIRVTAVEPPVPSIRVDQRTLDDGSIQVALRGIPVDPAMDGKRVVIRTDPTAGGPHVIPFRYVPRAP